MFNQFSFGPNSKPIRIAPGMLSNTPNIYETPNLLHDFKETVTNAQQELNNGKLNLDDRNLILNAEIGQMKEEGLQKVYHQVEYL